MLNMVDSTLHGNEARGDCTHRTIDQGGSLDLHGTPLFKSQARSDLSQDSQANALQQTVFASEPTTFLFFSSRDS